MRRNAKIVCTLGPASLDEDTIESLARAGMSIARFNASHGTPAQRRNGIEMVRRVEQRLDRPIGIILDLPGPEIRTMPGETVSITDGSTVTFAVDEQTRTGTIGLTRAINGVSVGDTILLDDGRIETEVTGIGDDGVEATVISGGELEGRSGVNIPGVDLELPTVSDADRKELDVAAEHSVEFVAASFVNSVADIYDIEAALDERGVEIPIIAKIERAQAVENIEDLTATADGIMVARGDLGVECPLEDVPIIQKRIIRNCHREGVPVITATEMLDSMIQERRPTRAEASDVANAVLDGTDALMLSGETAVGVHPVAVVETMDRIIADVESSEEYQEVLERTVPPADETRAGALARSARYLSRDIDASAIVVASESGYTARKAAKFRPPIPIVATTTERAVRRRLALSWGIHPGTIPSDLDSADAIVQNAVQSAIDADVAQSGDTVVVLSGMMTTNDELDTANMLKVHVASQRVTTGRSVVSGFVTGPIHRVTDGDLSEAPEGAILAVPSTFDGEFTGDLQSIGGIIDAHDGMTGYGAIIARELGVPMVSQVSIDLADGRVVSVDAERGVVYADPVDE